MILIVAVLPVMVVWCLLAADGIKRGRRGEVVIFRSWVDFALTAALVIPPLSLIVAVPWLWMTARANRRHYDLWVVVPAKISLILLAGFCVVLTIRSVMRFCSGKR